MSLNHFRKIGLVEQAMKSVHQSLVPMVGATGCHEKTAEARVVYYLGGGRASGTIGDVVSVQHTDARA